MSAEIFYLLDEYVLGDIMFRRSHLRNIVVAQDHKFVPSVAEGCKGYKEKYEESQEGYPKNFF
jgi:hypothetical protein